MTNKKGFTLVEMMVTVAIIGIMLISAIPAYGKYAERQKLNQAAKEVASVIRQAQNLALAPDENKPSGVDSPNSYAFVCDNQTYEIRYAKDQELLTNYKTFPSLPKNISFDLSQKIIFRIPSGKIANTGNIVIVLKDNKLTSRNTKTITINAETGQVEITNN